MILWTCEFIEEMFEIYERCLLLPEFKRDRVLSTMKKTCYDVLAAGSRSTELARLRSQQYIEQFSLNDPSIAIDE